jgi:hypothetical protein
MFKFFQQLGNGGDAAAAGSQTNTKKESSGSRSSGSAGGVGSGKDGPSREVKRGKQKPTESELERRRGVVYFKDSKPSGGTAAKRDPSSKSQSQSGLYDGRFFSSDLRLTRSRLHGVPARLCAAAPIAFDCVQRLCALASADGRLKVCAVWWCASSRTRCWPVRASRWALNARFSPSSFLSM